MSMRVQIKSSHGSMHACSRHATSIHESTSLMTNEGKASSMRTQAMKSDRWGVDYEPTGPSGVEKRMGSALGKRLCLVELMMTEKR